MGFAKSFGLNLARARIKAGISQEELGVQASMHRTAVGQLERGERVCRLDTFVKLMGSLGVEPEVLLDGLSWAPGGTRLGEFGVSDSPEEGR